MLKKWRRLLRESPDFARLFAGQSLYFTAHEIWVVGVSFLVLGLKGTAFWIGLVTAAGNVPQILFSAPAGWLSDHITPRRLLLQTFWMRTLLYGCVAALGLSGRLSLPVFCVLAFAIGSLDVGHTVSTTSWIPSLIRKENIVLANSLWEALFSIAVGIVASMTSGFVIDSLGPYRVGLFQGAILMAFMLLALRIPASPTRGAIRTSFQEGIRWFRKDDLSSRLLGSSMVMATIANLGFFAMNTQFIFYCASVLHYNAKTIGIVVSTVGVTQLATSYVFPRLTKVMSLTQIMLLGALVGAGGFSLMATANTMWKVIAAIVLSWGFAQKLFRIVRLSLCHELAPQALMGRVVGIWATFTDGAFSLAAILFGALADKLGYHATFMTAMGLCLLAAAWYAVSPVFRTETDFKEEPARAAS